MKCLRLPPRSPNWNAFAERWVRSVKQECLSHRILFGERSLRKALIQFQEHYYEERNHQGKNNVLPFPCPCSACARSATWHPLSRTSRRPTPILQSRRMNILTKRVPVQQSTFPVQRHCTGTVESSFRFNGPSLRFQCSVTAGPRAGDPAESRRDARLDRLCGLSKSRCSRRRKGRRTAAA